MNVVLAGLKDRIQADPQTFSEILRLSLLAAVALGFRLSPEQILAVMAPVSLALLFFSRRGTTSTATPVLEVGTPVNAGSAVVASVAPPPPPVADVGAVADPGGVVANHGGGG